MASVSVAHICSYSASMSAIAGLVWPRQFVVASDIRCARLALITCGGTIAANADSWMLAAAAAWVPACSAWAAVAFSQPMWGAAAGVLPLAAGPCGPCASFEVTARQYAAVSYRRAASWSQAVAATMIDPEPGPQCIRPDLISGGSFSKSIASSLDVRRGGWLGRPLPKPFLV